MISRDEFQFIQDKIYSLFDFRSNVPFFMIETEDVYLSFDGKKAEICGSIKSNTARALSLFIKQMRQGKSSFEIVEKKHFKSLGFSLDVSRNAVMKTEKLKKCINYMAALGFDSLMLYMEDVYEIPEYQYFGYRRGRYTKAELKEIDDYGYQMGIEIVPSIQTLGHMEQYLKWKEAGEIRENNNVLLCGEEKSYTFIDRSLSVISECFRSRRINLGCDEAGGIGCGNYLRDNPYRDRHEILAEHLQRVEEICKKYQFQPMLCGDLFLRYDGKYYDFTHPVDQRCIDDFPKMDVLYWDYYHTDKEDFEILLKKHLTIGSRVIFYGGIWTWCGLLPNPDHTMNTMDSALSVMLEYNIDEVWGATYGDDGSETNMLFAIPSLPVFSEKCFKGVACTREDIADMSHFLTGVPYDAWSALSEMHYPFISKLTRDVYDLPNYMGKKIFYSDIFYNFTNTYDFSEVKPHNERGRAVIEGAGKGTEWEIHFDYARLVFDIILHKIDVICELRRSYDNDDKAALERIAQQDIPQLIEQFDRIHMLAESLWLSTNKVFGWEELDNRFGSIRSRLLYAKRTILNYLAGKLDQIEEMEYDFIEDFHGDGYYCGGVALYRKLTSTAM